MIRVFQKSGATLTDLSNGLSKYRGPGIDLTYSSGDYLYIGRDLPFNNFYLKLGTTVNAISATMVLEYWDGRAWVPTVEVIDETNALAQSGHVTFTPNREKGWNRESTSGSGESITGLESVVIYDKFWLRISFSATLTPAIDVTWLGQIFSDDIDLYSEFPVLNSANLLSCWETGKTNWQEQHAKASEKMIQDLIHQGIIQSGEQILKRQSYNLAATSKTAELIFTGLGDDYTDDAVKARESYKDRLDLSIHPVDKNENAILDTKEKFERTGFLTR